MRPRALFWTGLVAAVLLLALPADGRRGFRLGGWRRTGGSSWGGSTSTGSFSSYTPSQTSSANIFRNLNSGSTWSTHTSNNPYSRLFSNTNIGSSSWNAHTSNNPYSRLFGDTNIGSSSWNGMSSRHPKGNWDWMKSVAVTDALSHSKPKVPGLSVPVLHHYKYRHGWRGKVGDLYDSREENGRLVVVLGSPRIPSSWRPVCYGSSCSASACEVVCTALPCSIPPVPSAFVSISERCNFTCVATGCTGAEGLLNLTRQATPLSANEDLTITDSKPDCSVTDSCNVTEPSVVCNTTDASCNVKPTTAPCDEDDVKCKATRSPAGCSDSEDSCKEQQHTTLCEGYKGSCNFTCSAVPCNAAGGFCNFACADFPCNTRKNRSSCLNLYLNVTVQSETLSSFTCKPNFCYLLAGKFCSHSCLPRNAQIISHDDLHKYFEEQRRRRFEALVLLAILQDLESKSEETKNA